VTDPLGDRMKEYEQQEAGRKAMPLLPLCIRLDGKGFSRYTADLNRPFDERLTHLMIAVTEFLVDETNACIGYTQSDEISLILYSSTYDSQLFFDGKLQKLTSVLAAMASSFFNSKAGSYLPPVGPPRHDRPLAFFDCRAWNVPNQVEAVNVLVWRQQDAVRNSVQMAAQSFYSHKQLQGKNGKELLEALVEKEIYWGDYPSFFKYGTFVQKTKRLVELTKEQLEKIPEKHRPTAPVERSIIREIYIEKLSSVVNKTGVVFNGEDPENPKEKTNENP
jgi:tRNA(His) guanylyltransferase